MYMFEEHRVGGLPDWLGRGMTNKLPFVVLSTVCFINSLQCVSVRVCVFKKNEGKLTVLNTNALTDGDNDQVY